MKINEVLDEGITDFAQGFYGAGKQAKQASAKQAALTKTVVGTALQKWAAVAQSMKSAGQQVTPDAAVRWFSNFIKGTPTSAPAGVNPNQINQWLTKEISNYIVQKELATASAPTKYAKGTPAAPTAGADLELAPAGTDLSSQPPTPPAPNAMGIAVVRNTDAGSILRYKGNNYWPNNRGDWAIDGKDSAAAVATPQLQQEMDKAAGLGSS